MVSKKELNKKYYENNGEGVQLKRVIKRLEAGVNVRMATLVKYGLYNATENKVIVPETYRTPEMNFNDLVASPPSKIEVVRQEPPPKIIYHNPNEVCTGEDLIEFLKSPDAMFLSNGRKRTTKTLNEYSKIPMDVAKIYDKPYNATENIGKALNDVDKIINGYKKLYPNSGQEGTVAKKLNGILYVIQNCPKLITAVHKDAVSQYNAESQRLQGSNTARLEAKRKSTSIFNWDCLCDFIKEKYPKYSKENLIMHLYTDIIGRDDFGLPIVHDLKEANKPENYVYMNFAKKEALIHLKNYKTAGAYGDQNIQLSPSTNDVLFHVIKPDEKTLFDQSKLGGFIRRMFTGLNEPEMGVKYFRRSRVSTELLRLDPKAPDYGARRQILAENAMHSVNTQEKYNYQFKSCADVSSAPVKQINPRVLKDFDEEVIKIRSRCEREIKEPDKKEPTDYTGRQVDKRFADGKIYVGKVIHYIKKTKKWKVKYNDGKVHKYSVSQLEKIVV